MEFDGETIAELTNQLKALAEASVNVVPTFAKIYRKMYTSLIEEGFTEEQSMKIVCNYQHLGAK